MTRRVRPKLAVFKLASCDGCQLTLLDCEDELLAIAGAVRIAHFSEASSRRLRGPYDVALVEGSVSTARDAARIVELRESARILVTLGACATAGGVQALRNLHREGELARLVYPQPELLDSLAGSTPISAHVKVDVELRGCPIDKRQLLQTLADLLAGRVPRPTTAPVCLECKLRGVTCVVVARGASCLGPVTVGGCGALCPAHHRGCFGCFGPTRAPATEPLSKVFLARGARPGEVARLYTTIQAGAPAFAAEAARLGD